MTPKALVVDDDPDILELVGDILKSLGHKYDTASCQQEARQLLAQNRYAYYLVDLELPVLAGGGFPRIQNGENLVREIIRQRGSRREPVIIITGHGTTAPKLAVRMMKLGANDYVTKPFPTTGDTLDKAILEALGDGAPEKASGNASAPPSTAGPPAQFKGGNLTFYPDRVELCGIKACGGRRNGLIRRVLDVLRAKRPSGQYVALSGTELGAEVGCSGDQNKIAGCIRDFRRNTRQLLLNEAKVQCGLQDVIRSDRTGYHLHEWIIVQDGDSPLADLQGHGDPVNDPVNADHDPVNRVDDPVNINDDPVNDPENADHDPVNRVDDPVNLIGDPVNDPVNADHDPVNRVDDPVNVDDDPVNHRQAWILGELRKGRQLRAPAIAAALKCSCKTAKRDLELLRTAGHVIFAGPPKTGFYQTRE